MRKLEENGSSVGLSTAVAASSGTEIVSTGWLQQKKAATTTRIGTNQPTPITNTGVLQTGVYRMWTGSVETHWVCGNPLGLDNPTGSGQSHWVWAIPLGLDSHTGSGQSHWIWTDGRVSLPAASLGTEIVSTGRFQQEKNSSSSSNPVGQEESLCWS